jgi:acetylglutamate kinase
VTIDNSIEKAGILAAALPFMQRYSGRTIVIKYGGHAMGDKSLSENFARDVVMLKQAGVHPVIVHGGGPQIGDMLARLNIKSEFAAGLRITDKETVEVVEMVLAGAINKQIVAEINRFGGRAIGISGKDAGLVTAKKVTRTIIDPDSSIEKMVDLGFVGEPESVNRDVLDILTSSNLIPVIAPLAISADGETYNVNADTFAGAIAGALEAERLLLLTDVPGVFDKDRALMKQLSVADCERLVADGTISEGMIPKVETCIKTLEQGVKGIVILNGKVPHAVLLELFTEHGAGTMILQ